jgi:hypothetical protein
MITIYNFLGIVLLRGNRRDAIPRDNGDVSPKKEGGDAWAHLRLEPCARKLARTVPRGERVSNDPELLDSPLVA